MIVSYCVLITCLISMIFAYQSIGRLKSNPISIISIKHHYQNHQKRISSSFFRLHHDLKEYLIGGIDEKDEEDGNHHHHHNTKQFPDILSSFMNSRSNISILSRSNSHNNDKRNQLQWILTRNNVVLDRIDLEMHYLSGKHRLSVEENVKLWIDKCNRRLCLIDEYVKGYELPKLGDGGKLQQELDIAISAVHRASYLSIYMQLKLQNNSDIMEKKDNTPVTLADLSVQALVIDQLSRSFPKDKFIAEEDSTILRSDSYIRNGVLNILQSIGGNSWSEHRLLTAIDKGNEQTTKNHRVWVLDPIDGTKGFIRGEHYCIALSLLENGVPILSVLGCPNLSLERVLSGDQIEYIQSGFHIKVDGNNNSSSSDNSDITENLYIPGDKSGSIYFAVTGQGAFARSLSMPLGAAVEVQVSSKSTVSDAILCESAEASFGNRKTTSKIRDLLKIHRDFLRLDGQCKLCLVGSGAAESNIRLPPRKYTEKIWDHAAGYHYIKEAGGKVTDLNGNDLDFTLGRSLSSTVNGIVASNGKLHSKILDAVHQARHGQ